MSITEHYISRRPAWAETVAMGPDTIDYTWTAPTVADVIEPPDGELIPVEVQLFREDAFSVGDNGVLLDEGPERVFVLDARLDLQNARKLATAILECCDRYDSTDDTQ